MTKILLRKQLAETFRTYLYDAKKNKARSKGTVIAYFVLFALLMVGLLGGMFTFVAFMLRSTIVSGYGWFYYLIFALSAVCIGAFGSVFNTFSGLYLSRDNDLLLSMPIPVHSIMASRLLTVFLMGLMYSGVVSIPAAIVYLATAGFSVSALLGAVLFVALIAVFVLVLSCLLGYGVARLSLKLKNKSFMTVIFALLFIAIYYFAYFKAGSFIGEIVANIALYGEETRAAAPLVFGIGRAFEGDLLSLLLVTLAVAVLFALTWYILSRSFLKIATATGKTDRKVYRETRAKRKSVFSAMLGKELGRFTGSANYMLNCGLSTLLLPVAGVLLLIRGGAVAGTLESVFETDGAVPVLLLTAAVCLVCSMNDMAVPSVSLEGKTLWISRSLPVDAWTVLRAKCGVQLLLTAPGAVFAAVCSAIALRAPFVTGFLMALCCAAFVFFSTYFALYIGLHNVNLVWTNEINVIKQGSQILIALLAGWAAPVILALPYMLVLHGKISGETYLALVTLVLALAAAFFRRWLRTKGAERFENL